MELHPFFEKGSSVPQNDIWYVLGTDGDSPSMRVGSTATFIEGKKENEDGRLYIIGGANPDGTFAEINLLDLSTMTWDRLDTPSRISRYEHAVSTYHSDTEEASSSIIIFGGAVQSGNLNDVQKYSISDETWSPIATRGTSPCARTQHSMSAFFSDGRLVVFGGGVAGVDPVNDRQMYIFDPSTSTWSEVSYSGQPPDPRHGHLILVCCGNNSAENPDRVFVHGGMFGQTFFDDLHVYDMSKNQWNAVRINRGKPCARAAHGGVVWKEKLYIFGGMCNRGALDDMWAFDTGAKSWTEIKYDGPPPPSRLDFACCLITLRTKRVESEEKLNPGNGTKESGDTENGESNDNDSSGGASVSTSRSEVTTNEGSYERSIFFLISGGMDTQGTIFDDTLIFMIDHEPLKRNN